jgi:trk system potassium uptake protein TrkA
MHIIIAGAGNFGLGAAEKLSRENHDIILIDKNPEKIEMVSSTIDCQTVVGSASSLKILKEAGIDGKADMLLAMTNDDHVNIISCLIAKEFNLQKRIAKISDPEFHEPGHVLELKAGNILVSPEKSAADEIVRLFEMPLASEFNYFAKSLGAVATFHIDSKHPFVGKALQELKSAGIGVDFIVTAIDRNNHTIVPKGQVIIEENDTIYLAGAREKIRGLAADKSEKSAKQIIIVGGGNLACRVALALQNVFPVKIIEPDYNICKDLAQKLNRTIVLNGDGTDTQLLKTEKIDKCKAILSLTSDEESNILIGLLGKSMGAEKAICLTHKQEYSKLVAGLGIDATVNPRTAAISQITKHVRRGRIEKVVSFKSNNVEAIEFIATPGSEITKAPIMNLILPENTIIGGIVNKNTFHLPTGPTRIEPGDHVIVFVLPEQIKAVESLFHNEL